MLLHFEKDGVLYAFDSAKPIDISLPLDESTDNVNCYYAEPVRFETISFGDTFVGSVAKGGCCNYQKITLTPHGNGTHTECLGHIVAEKITIHEQLKEFLFLARLISLTPTSCSNGDAIITTESIKEALCGIDNLPEALIIRSLPNEESKRFRQYSGTNPPYIEDSAGIFLREMGVLHLLVDIPSVDRESDEGKLSMHHQFWNMWAAPRWGATITELVYIDTNIQDGLYMLNLQIISLQTDASPSKPVLYSIFEKK